MSVFSYLYYCCQSKGGEINGWDWEMRNRDRGEGVGNQSQEKGRGSIIWQLRQLSPNLFDQRKWQSHPIPSIASHIQLTFFLSLLPLVLSSHSSEREKEEKKCDWGKETEREAKNRGTVTVYMCGCMWPTHTHACLTALSTALHLLWGPLPAQFHSSSPPHLVPLLSASFTANFRFLSFPFLLFFINQLMGGRYVLISVFFFMVFSLNSDRLIMSNDQ